MALFNRTENGVMKVTQYSRRLDWHQNGKLIEEGGAICPDDWEFGSYIVREIVAGEIVYERPQNVCRPD